MKVPEHPDISSVVYAAWAREAAEISLESGIFVDVVWLVGRMFFKVEDNEFETLADLKRALNNKAFL